MKIMPANFEYWKDHSPSLPLPKDSNPKQLGSGGRNYQTRCYNQFRGKKYTIFVSPTGSGKSLVQVFNAAREILDSDYKQKQVFVVPQLNIGFGFTEKKHSQLRIDGTDYTWEISVDCCNLNNDSVQRIKKFLLEDRSCKSYKSQNVIGGNTAVVSYAALLAAFNSMSEEEKLKAIDNVSFRLDEVHHISGVDEEVSYANRLGEFCKFVLDHEGSLHLTTATFFRGDYQKIISDDYLKQFEVFRVPFLEHWDTLGLKGLSQNYCSYDDSDHLLNQILDSIKSEPNKHPIIIVPSDGQKFFKKVDKWKWVNRLVKGLNKIYGEDKVLDLVSEDRQKNDKLRLMSENQDFSAVVTCSIGKEGSDWPICSRIYNTVLDNNVLQPIQKLGRALRQHESKEDVKMINYIQSFEKWDSNLAREKLSDRFNAVMAFSLLDDMFFPVLMPTLPKEDDKPKYVSLEDVYGSHRSEVVEEIITRVLMLEECNAENIDKIIEEVIEEFSDCVLEDVSYEDLKSRFRLEVLRRQNPNNSRFRENLNSFELNGFEIELIRKEGWDKVVKEFVQNRSPFAGFVDKKDIKELQDLLKRIYFDSAAENKKMLIVMAKNGDPRPNQKKHPLGKVLCRYTNENQNSYDPTFDKLIRELRPDWFLDTAAEKKKMLIQMAKKGEPRPNKKHPLGRVLCYYTSKNNECYDLKFNKLIRELRPDWFLDTAAEKKKMLIQMAKNGDPKPSYTKHPLGVALYYYTNKSQKCYDPEFDKLIRELRPDWFGKTTS